MRYAESLAIYNQRECCRAGSADVLARLCLDLTLEGSQSIDCRLDLPSVQSRLRRRELAGEGVSDSGIIDTTGS